MGNPQNQNDPFALARKYREAGWLGTLPLPKAKKETPPTGFTGHGRPYPTDKQIEDWYQPGAEQNIALRLAEVPGYVPKGMAPREYELMAIDVDDYGDKNGAEQLANLEAKLGALPATVTASSRFDTAPNSGHRVFIVPAGHRFLGKAAPAIDIVQKSHRYLVVWPSVNPDAPRPGPLAGLAVYRWRDPNGAYYDERDDGAAIPALDDVAVLPDAWFDYLTCGGQIAVDVPISELTLSELNQWAKDTWNDPMGDMCRLTEQQLERQIEKMKSRPDSHPNLTEAHAELCYLAMEGHTGVIGAINQYSTKWLKMAAEKRDGIPPMSEINRSYLGMLSKLEPQWRVNGEYMPDDPCDCKVDAPESVETWLNLEDIDPEVAKAIAEMDYGGLGPIVGKLLAQAGLECEAKEPGDYDQNDHGNAQHFIDLYGTNIKYVNARKDWVLWDGERWHRDLDATLAGLAFDVVKRRQMVYAQSLPIDSKEAIQVKRSWRNWALKSGNASQIAGALKLARGMNWFDEPIAMHGKEFDAKPTLLGCANGILELTANPVLRPPRKEDYVTYNTNVEYHPWDVEYARENGLEDAYTLWQNYLEKFLPDPEIRQFVQKVLGHCLIGENPEKLIIFVYGPHDTGKSTLLGGIRGALGDYYGTVDVALFKQKDLNPGLIRAVPMRVTGMSEVDNNRMDGATIKRLTGNDMVAAEAKGSNVIFEGRPQFTTLIACNSEPDITGADEALRERVLILPFETTIPRAERNYTRQAEIERQSGEAVLAWLVEGWKMYCREGLKRSAWPARIKRLSGEVVNHFNAVQTFIVEHVEKYTECEDGQKAWELAKRNAKRAARGIPNATDWPLGWQLNSAEIFSIYTNWCSDSNVHAVSKIEFSKALGMGRTFQKKVDGVRKDMYLGARMRRDEDG